MTYGVTGIADVTASSYIVWMKNIETNDLIRLTVYSYACIRLAHKESRLLE